MRSTHRLASTVALTAALLSLTACEVFVPTPMSDCSRVGETTGWEQVAVGPRHSCALHSDGSVQCWGSDEVELGRKSDSDISFPEVGERYVLVTAGDDFTCAQTEEGAVECWGGVSEVRTGPFMRPSWVQVDSSEANPGTRARVSARGDAVCGILDGGTPQCWGPGGLVAQNELVLETPANERLVQLDLSTTAACGVREEVADEGAVVCWGDLEAEDIAPASFVATGEGYACATDDSETLRCFGEASPLLNVYNQGIPYVELIPLGDRLCGLDNRGGLDCYNDLDGGDPEAEQLVIPEAGEVVSFLSVDWSAGIGQEVGEHTCGVRASDGRLWCVGDNQEGQSSPP